MGTVTLSTEEYEELIGSRRRKRSAPSKAKASPRSSRKASANSKKYGRAFKRLAPRYKKKGGGWKKGGFKACVRAAHKAARK